jgi:hypothetical protein
MSELTPQWMKGAEFLSGDPESMPKQIRELKSQLAAMTQERDVAVYALQSKGYRKSCDIRACNCGDQWNHGGHAEERLRELRDALPYVNGKTLLTIATDLVEERDRLLDERNVKQAALRGETGGA